MTQPSTITCRADLERYIACFNAKDYDGQIAHYAPDVEYRVGTLTLDSPQAIKGFYQDFHQYAEEEVRLADFAMTGDTVAVIIPTIFRPFRDYLKHGLTFRAGEEVRIVTLAFYTLRDGKIRRIRMARYGGPLSDFGL